MPDTKHISVCVCTFKRPDLLKKLLEELKEQETAGLFTYSIVVVDNDRQQSAKPVIEAFASAGKVSIGYFVETQPSIALARNKTIQNASGDFVAFIDDDEFPIRKWLLTMLKLCENDGVDGVLGPVLPHFDVPPPRWIIKGKFFDRPRHPTSMKLDWSQTRTGNVLLRRSVFAGEPEPFDPQCVEGSDQEFFKRMIQKGHSFEWCDEGIVYEVVPKSRWKRSFLLRRAISRGVFSVRNHGFPVRLIATSVFAAPAYALVALASLFLGQARFMYSIFKMSYHLGRILAVLRFDSVSRQYVSE